jgi:uncharacterized repeat protein (TIGR03837 family)
LVREHAIAVRLWVDDLQTFACMFPTISSGAAVQHADGVEVRRWTSDFPDVDPADVVIEAFGCTLPETYIDAMARRVVPVVWINLEYLSAESWVEECHRLPSPQSKPGLNKFFFFPGFTPRTGGLIRERGLLEKRAAFDDIAARSFWQEFGIPAPAYGELRISLFCYQNAALPTLLDTWAGGPDQIRLMATAGAATSQVSSWLGQTIGPNETGQKGSLIVHPLPFLPQPQYDRLLWACDMNFVRGEDSFVRAQWSQRPFVWHIYSQSQDAHLTKLDAFLSRYLSEFSQAEPVRRFWRAWNGDGDVKATWKKFIENHQFLAQHGQVWTTELDRLGNLADNLVCFARDKSTSGCVV